MTRATDHGLRAPVLAGVLAGALAMAAASAPATLTAQEHGHAGHAGPPPAADAAPAGRDAAPPSCPAREDGPATLRVGSGADHATVAGALGAARAGDTVVVEAGVYRERPEVACPVVLEGRDGAVLDGGGEGTVLRLRGPGVVIRGLTIRGTGRSVSREDSGIMAEAAPGVVVENVRMEDVLFGVYLKESPDALIRGNRVHGKELPVNVRGDAIRLWYSSGGRIEKNVVRRGRDVVIWFSDSVRVSGNDVADGRYGLHYMYSDHNRFEDNRFRDNLVGAFLMYSSDLRFRGNVFAGSSGASGLGLGLKDADRIDARRNLFVDNIVGIYLDNSPRSAAGTNHFVENRVVGNDVGVRVLSSSRGNRFRANDFADNAREVDVPGGGRAASNDWRGNYWSRYAGFDSDADGVGDTPFVLSRLSDHLISTNPRLALFTFSPGAETLDVLARVLPFLEPRPVAVDSTPLVRPVARGAAPSPARETASAAAGTRPGDGAPPPSGSTRSEARLWSWALAAAFLAAGWSALRLRRFAGRRAAP